MTKKTKKGLLIGGGIIVVLLAAMLIIPVLFKGKIKDAVLKLANENLKAKVEIEDFSLSLFRNFPNATLSLENTYILGVDSFAGDTLLSAKDLSVTINLKSLFSDNYEVKNISLNEATVEVKFDKQGAFNWDITKDTSASQDTLATQDGNFNLALQDISVNKSIFKYIDLDSNMEADLFDINGKINGDFSASETTLNVKATSGELKFYMDNIAYLSKINVDAEAKVNANFDQMKFTFESSRLMLNELLTEIDGSFGFIGDDGYNFDLKLKAPSANFTQILSLVPAMYNDELKSIKTSGSVSLEAYIVGDYTESSLPNLNLLLMINDAMFQYPQLPKPVQDINLYLNVNGKPSGLDQLKVSVDKFGFRIDNNKFDGSFSSTPLANDQMIEAKINGKIDLGSIKDVYPLPDSIKLGGNVVANLNLKTTMSALEKEDFNKISASGSLILSDMQYHTSDMPNVDLKVVDVQFNAMSIDLNKLDIVVGKSDLQAEGKLQNALGYLFNNQTVKGNLSVKSSLLDLDEMMGEDKSSSTADTTSIAFSEIQLPTDIDFVASCNIASLKFNDIDMTNFSGKATIKDGNLTLSDAGAGILGGLATINGSYISNNGSTPTLNMDMSVTRVSFAETFQKISIIKKLAPIFEEITGNYSMNLSLSASLLDNTSDMLNTLNAKGTLLSNDFTLDANSTLKSLGSLLKTDKLDKVSAQDINLPFEIKDGTLTTRPFNLNLNNGIQLALEGSTKLNQTIDYKGTVTLPASLTNGMISKVPLTIVGSFTDPKVSIDTKSVATDALTNTIGNLVGAPKNEDGTTTLDLDEEKAKKIAELRQKADEQAEQLVQLAKEKSDLLVKNAGSNQLAQLAAKKAAEEAVKQAEKEAQKLRDAAEVEIKKLEGTTETQSGESSTPENQESQTN